MINESVPTPQTTIPVPKVEIPITPKVETPPAPKIEIPVAAKVETPSVPEKSLSVVKPITVESTTRNILVNSSEKPPSDDSKVPTRTVVNRNVVIGDSNRKVVQGNRVVVPSNETKHDSDSDLDDLIEQENYTKKSKFDS